MCSNKMIAHLLNDPLRVLTLVGGSGGLVYWYDRYKNRTRLRIKILNLGLTQPDPNNNKMRIQFEIENLGTKPTSIDNLVYVSGITPKCIPNSTGKKHTFTYKLNNADRNLPPHDPRTFEAYANWDDRMRFIWFIRITFTATRGRSKTIFIRSISNKRLNGLRYIYERYIKYGIFNKVSFIS